MPKRQTKEKPAAEPKTITPAEAPTGPDRLSDLIMRVCDAAIHDLSLEEGELPAFARRVLRMRRDKAPHDELLRVVEPLFKSIGLSVLKQKVRRDPASGMSIINIKPTPELKALLHETR